MPDVNYLAVLLAALSSFVIGGLWYSPLLFQKPWIAASGQSKEHLSSGNPAIVFGGAFLLNLAAAFVLAMWLAERGTDVQDAASAGFAVGLGLVATSIGVIYLFERRLCGGAVHGDGSHHRRDGVSQAARFCTVNCNPKALRTPTSVSSVGLPFSDSAL